MPTVESALSAVAQALEPRVDSLVDEVFDRMRRDIPQFDPVERAGLLIASRRSCHANLRVGLAALGGKRVTPAVPPTEAGEEARQAARIGVPLQQVLQAYRIGHAVLWERLIEEVERLDLTPELRTSTLQLGSRYLFAYVDAALPVLTDAYTSERDTLIRGGERRRAQLVRDLLAGAPGDGGELGYDPQATHLGAIGWGDGAEESLRAVAAELGRPILCVSESDDVAWGWIAASGLSPEDWRRVMRFEPVEGSRLALGAVASGLEGFRRTHQEAQKAYMVALRRSHAVTRFADVVVEAFALADAPAARQFVSRELGPLGGDDARSARLRETLQAYLESSSNASAAAALLGVTDRTVAYRLRGIEDLLGYPLVTRALELQLALRLHGTFAEVG